MPIEHPYKPTHEEGEEAEKLLTDKEKFQSEERYKLHYGKVLPKEVIERETNALYAMDESQIESYKRRVELPYRGFKDLKGNHFGSVKAGDLLINGLGEKAHFEVAEGDELLILLPKGEEGAYASKYGDNRSGNGRYNMYLKGKEALSKIEEIIQEYRNFLSAAKAKEKSPIIMEYEDSLDAALRAKNEIEESLKK